MKEKIAMKFINARRETKMQEQCLGKHWQSYSQAKERLQAEATNLDEI
tara:strand:+ start:186 stop:329 length:144 start_codon:yes stop_codon:yes gene_type:complete